jgi:hypothetical protein
MHSTSPTSPLEGFFHWPVRAWAANGALRLQAPHCSPCGHGQYKCVRATHQFTDESTSLPSRHDAEVWHWSPCGYPLRRRLLTYRVQRGTRFGEPLALPGKHLNFQTPFGLKDITNPESSQITNNRRSPAAMKMLRSSSHRRPAPGVCSKGCNSPACLRPKHAHVALHSANAQRATGAAELIARSGRSG